jgi:hypothetical protein
VFSEVARHLCTLRSSSNGQVTAKIAYLSNALSLLCGEYGTDVTDKGTP